MKKQRGEATNGGIGILGLLGVIFVVLKIIEVKPIGDWSWWWVTAPFWGGFAIFALIVFGAGAFAILMTLIKAGYEWARDKIEIRLRTRKELPSSVDASGLKTTAGVVNEKRTR